MSLSATPLRWLGLLPVLLASCAVYAPTTPSTPLLQPREVEVYGSLRSSSLEGGAAWSPRSHLLLSAETAYQSSEGSETSNGNTFTYTDYHRQGSLGIGYCRPALAPAGWYLAALGGIGFASTNLHAFDVGFVSPFVPIPLPIYKGLYEARYRRYYLQGYAAHALSPRVTGGFSVRGTLVDYTQLTFEGQALHPTTNFFLEPTLFVRVGHGVLQGQSTLGLSLPGRRRSSDALSDRTAPVSSLFSFGIVLRPDLLWQKLHRADR